MLDKIIVSRTRRKILKLFFENPSKNFYLRQIARKVKEEINGVKREMDILSSSKVLIQERISNRSFFYLNRDWIFFQEFLHIFFKDSIYTKTLLKNLPLFGKVKFLVFSEKFAKKEPIKSTEVYLLVVGTIVIPEITRVIAELEKSYGKEINYTVMSKDEFDFRKKNRDPFLWNFLKQPKIVIVGKEEKLMK